jgi:hypothetical protein
MAAIRTKMIMDAPVEAVWGQLTDFDSYPAWNPYFRELEGEPNEGMKARLVVQRPDAKPESSKIRFVTVSPPQKLTWTEGFFVPGILEKRHSILLRPMGNHQTVITQVHHLSGLFGSLAYSLCGASVRRGLAQMNHRLRERVERLGTDIAPEPIEKPTFLRRSM